MKGILIGIRHNPLRAFIYWFTSFSVLWTLIEGLIFFMPSLKLQNPASLVVVAVIGIIYTAATIRRPSKIEIPIHHTNTRIEIKFGDLFEEDGYRVIPVGEFFESEIGTLVSAKSLHGTFLSKCFGGYNQAFDQIIEKELKESRSEKVPKSQGKTQKYPIGTTATVPVNNDRYLCFALTKTEIDYGNSYSDVKILWEALNGLWHKARISLDGSVLVLPLVGSALAGTGLPKRDLLNLIILSVITETKHKHIATCVRIILAVDLFDKIDLREVKRHWR